jgi:hypothetical protein
MKHTAYKRGDALAFPAEHAVLRKSFTQALGITAAFRIWIEQCAIIPRCPPEVEAGNAGVSVNRDAAS